MSRRGEDARGDLPDGVAIRQVDVTLAEDLPETLAGADALVISLAFRNSPSEAPRRRRTFEAVDAAGTERLVAAAQEAGVRQIIYISVLVLRRTRRITGSARSGAPRKRCAAAG